MNESNEKKFFLRDSIGNAIVDIGESNEDIVLVSANVLASCKVAGALDKYPERVFTVGIAEQNMISFAAGLAREGKKAYTFTMAPFMSMRACEQVRTDVAYNKLDVKMVAPYAGVSGGISGATHWAIEDCGIMNSISGMIVLEPSDPIQAREMVKATEKMYGPIYIRIGIEPVPQIYPRNYQYTIGKADYPIEGKDGAVICSGVIVKYAILASKRIKKEYDKEIMVVDMHTIKPIDKVAVEKAAKTGHVLVAQDHNKIGGLGQMVATVLAENGWGIRFKILGLPDYFVKMAHAPYLYHKYGYDDEGIYLEMKHMLGL